jgi:hypothetical protein
VRKHQESIASTESKKTINKNALRQFITQNPNKDTNNQAKQN